MYILEIINASTLEVPVKANLCYLVEQVTAALNETEAATRFLFKSKGGLNERQYSQRLCDSRPGEKRDELIMTQASWRNLFTNSVYRIQGARRRLKQLGWILHEQIASLDVRDSSSKTVAIALRSLIGQCFAAGGDEPAAVLRELNTVADVGSHQLIEAVCDIFLQKKAGRGKFHDKPFTSQPIMAVDDDSEEFRAVWQASQEAIKLFFKVRANFEEVYAAKSKINVPQFVERLEQAEAADAKIKFAQIVRERSTAEANFYVAASHLVSVIMAYQPQIDEFAAVIKALADTVGEKPSGKDLSAASACIGAWHWLHEMQMQIDIIFRNHDPRPMLKQMRFDADAFLTSAPLE